MTWRPSVPPDAVPRSVRQRHSGPYRAAIVPRIATTSTLTVDGATAALADEASREVTRFDAQLGGEVAPFASVLLRSESASSSQIEQLTAGAKAIAVAELGNGTTRNAVSVVGNVRAMRAALDLAGELDPTSILAMHAALLEEVEPAIAGRWRTEQVWIGGSSYGPHGAAFVPPVADDVPDLIDDLIAFARRDDIPPLVLAALAHAQFETIHPFPDGNGRTGRALIHALLRRYELTRAVTVPVSAGLLTDVDGYFAALTAYREGDPTGIVAALANGALEAIVNARQLVADLHQVRARWDDVVVARRDAAAWRVADLLLRQPVIDAATIARDVGVAPSNALRALEPLLAAGVVTEFSGRARNRLWQAREVLAAVDAFAARAGRRRPGS
ncbi:Fic family protein [Blastococcus sp. BMG 814]|uniref:Fic family protein n=1 Tax=Blastococcus carthaginiensis TaxID=3050034 RepID=A0ABT9IHK3_9ACTN|nr:Fic family protein [Blastococcus carthaginiensis]MDP5185063.1 Fic family protein [Blastococcus carthaginiensis]